MKVSGNKLVIINLSMEMELL